MSAKSGLRSKGRRLDITEKEGTIEVDTFSEKSKKGEGDKDGEEGLEQQVHEDFKSSPKVGFGPSKKGRCCCEKETQPFLDVGLLKEGPCQIEREIEVFYSR